MDKRQAVLHNRLQSTQYLGRDHVELCETSSARVYKPGMDPPRQNPYLGSTWLSWLTFSWTVPLIKLGYKRRLEREDIFKIPPCYETTKVTDALEVQWEKESEKKKTGGRPNIKWAMARAHGLMYLMYNAIILIEDFSRILQPVLLRYLIEYFTEDNNVSTQSAYLLATGIALCTVFEFLSGPQIVFGFVRSGLVWQSSMVGIVYRKVLRLSNSARISATSGYITDLVSSDCAQLDGLVWSIFSVWQAPLDCVIVTGLLYYELGPSIFAGVAVICVILPIQAAIAKIVAYYRKLSLSCMDERVGIIGEVVSAMRVIKMYCWEKPFGNIVHNIRRRELRFLWKDHLWSSILRELYTFNQRLITAVIILVFVATSGNLTPAKVFPAFVLLNILTETLLSQVPFAFQLWLNIGVSIKRIEDFLLLDEATPYDECVNTSTDIGEVKLTNVSASWSLDSPRLTLENVSIESKQGELLMVIGDVGSGKSSLLMSIIGELPVSDGTISCGGRIAYASQQPWVFSSTLRQNILFGREFESEKYYNVLKAAVLDKDVVELPYGDETLVGEKGVTLSGGQKSRLALARALYSEADVYLLDDPLSAVDTTVGNEIMKRCIKGMLKEKTVVLVTHQLQYLPEASKILVLQNGKIEQSATYSELLDGGFDFGKVHHHHNNSEHGQLNRQLSTESTSNIQQLTTKERPVEEEESREYGDVGLRVYKSYYRAGASWFVIFMFMLLCVATQASYNIGDWWLAVWSVAGTNNINRSISTDLNSTEDGGLVNNTGYASIYMVFITSMIMLGLARSWLFFKIVVGSSQTLHDKIYDSVIKAPVRFFDTTPKGRILNRFSGDIGVVDKEVPSIMIEFLQYFLTVCGSVLLMMIINPYLIIVAIPTIIVLIVIRTYYVTTNRHMTRLESTAKSPVLGHLTNTIEGVQVIRAFHAQNHCTQDFDKHQDLFSGTRVTSVGVFGWFQFWNDAIAGVFNVIVIYVCVIGSSYLGAGEAGLLLGYIIPFMWQTESCLRTSSEVETKMVNVERVLEYTSLPSERPLESDIQDKPASTWPENGKIVFDHMSFAYSMDSPIILSGIHCRIQAGEKVGIVGRTGAGKSSLIQALFRMAEPLGHIRVDDVTINEIGLHDVRGSMSIIPQDPVLFSGNVRYNLDPFSDADDEDLWNALEQVQLKDVVCELNGGLDSKVTEGGSNFSVGQKQLFCLARALLRKKKILVLDEATANVDKKTDDLIRKTIHEKFDKCTVLTIAHRLNTVMDSDRIMVLDKGRVVEYDVPYNLLKQKGLLYKMVEQTGQNESLRLTDIARTTLVNKTINTNR